MRPHEVEYALNDLGISNKNKNSTQLTLVDNQRVIMLWENEQEEKLWVNFQQKRWFYQGSL
jgi:hypothetical protein